MPESNPTPRRVSNIPHHKPNWAQYRRDPATGEQVLIQVRHKTTGEIISTTWPDRREMLATGEWEPYPPVAG